MKQIGDITARRSNLKPLDEESWPDESNFPVNLKEEVFIKHVKGPLFFGSTENFQQMAMQIPPTASTIIIRLGRMPYIDQSGLFVIEDILIELVKQGKTILLVAVLEQPRYMLESIDIIPNLVPEENVFKNFKTCLVWVRNNVEDVYKVA